MKLTKSFYIKPVLELAPLLLGKVLVHNTPEGTTKGRIVEVEAYDGTCDKGCHAYPCKKTPRTEVLFEEGGAAYVYLIYGMYCCLNVVADRKDVPCAVLIRALEPLAGQDLMAKRRKLSSPKSWCSGPGKLCLAMGISRDHNRMDLCGDELFLEDDGMIPDTILASKRINIDYAEEAADFLWRFSIKDHPFVSKKPKQFQIY